MSEKAELGGAIAGGVVTIIAMFALVVAVGGIGDFEALSIIEAVLPSARFLASAAIAAGATILALLLTLIGLSLNVDLSFNPRLYTRARYITVLSVVTIILGVAVLLAVTVPVREVEELAQFYDLLYYILAATISLLGGTLVTIGFMISATLIGLTELAHPDGHNLLLSDEPVPSDRGTSDESSATGDADESSGATHQE